MTAEATITCPKCKAEIKLTESLAAPLLEATRREYEQRLAAQQAETARQAAGLRERETALRQAEAGFDQKVAAQVARERARFAAEEARKARLEMGVELEQSRRETTEMKELLQQRDAKLRDAQQAQADALRKQRELDDARRELEVTVEQRVQTGLAQVREQARRDAESMLKLEVMEKDETIKAMQKQIDDLKRRSEQGSQQLQGEVQELELEALLRNHFLRDTVAPVPKGEHGGDVLQRVSGPQGQPCGTILWESKRTRNWSEGWLVKLREDQRAAKAEIAVLVTQALPRDMASFGLVDGVWVTPPQTALPLALVLRQALIDVAGARQASEGQQTKMGFLYQYLTGPRFRQRVQALTESFHAMKEDLDRERKLLQKQWAKREAQIERVLQATVGLYGDVQGIAGKSMPEVEGLDLPALGPAVEHEENRPPASLPEATDHP